ncbi:MAG: substrate-binding domain-containing protein [Microbacterium sp.]
MSIEEPAHRAPAAHRAAEVLRLLTRARRPLTLSAIAAAIGAPKASTLGVCNSLTAERMLVRSEDGGYWLGPGVAELASSPHTRRASLRKVGLTIPSRLNRFYTAEQSAAERESAQRGVQLTALAADEHVERQQDQIIGFVDDGADLVIVDPVSSEGLESALAYATRHGVPVVAVNAGAHGADLAITTDNAMAGSLAARTLLAAVPGLRRVAIVDGAGLTAIADRVQGFTETIQEDGDAQIVAVGAGDNSREHGESTAGRLLTEHPDVEAFFAVNDPTALGVRDACLAARSSAVIASVDGSSEVVELLNATDQHLICTAVQDPAALIAAAFRFGRALCDGYQLVHGTILLPSDIVTAQNAREYAPW